MGQKNKEIVKYNHFLNKKVVKHKNKYDKRKVQIHLNYEGKGKECNL